MEKLISRLIGIYLNALAVIAPGAAGRKGFYIFCTPQRAPLKAHQREFLDTADRSSFDHNGLRLKVYQWGHGKRRILFLHGWGSHTFRWKNYIASFPKEEYTILAFDAPGHGQSEGKYLNLPIYSSALEKFLTLHPVDTIISHSLGSLTSIYTFHRLPSLAVKNLVITGIPGEVNEFVTYYRYALGLSDRSVNEIRKAFVKIIGHFPEYYSARKFAEGLPSNGLIIHDELDDEAPYRHAVDIHGAWRKSALITTSGLGHNLRSPSVVKQVAEFVHASQDTEIKQGMVSLLS